MSSPTPPPALPADHPKLSSRILALDILRGYFILVIASVHLHYYPSLLGTFDGRGQLWISEAEGFFFISGLLIGIIRRRDLIKRGFRTASINLLKRGWKLYATAVVLSILYVLSAHAALAAQVPGVVKDGLADGSLLGTVWQIVTLRYSYGWADFLAYYAAFLFISPLVLWLLRRGLWWVVALLSFGAWTLRWAGSHGMIDPFLQWQVYFFLGSIVGYHWDTLRRAFHHLSEKARHRFRVILFAAIGLIYAVSMILVFLPEYYENRSLPGGRWGTVAGAIIGASHNYAYNRLLVDGRMGLARPIALLLTFAGLFLLVRRYERQILRFTGWLLVPFGQNSLYVYILQSALLFAIPLFIPRSNFLVNSLIEVFLVAMVWLAIRYRFLFRLIPR